MRFSLCATISMIPAFAQLTQTSARKSTIGLRKLHDAEADSFSMPTGADPFGGVVGMHCYHEPGSCDNACFQVVDDHFRKDLLHSLHNVGYGCGDNVPMDGLCVSTGECGTTSKLVYKRVTCLVDACLEWQADNPNVFCAGGNSDIPNFQSGSVSIKDGSVFHIKIVGSVPNTPHKMVGCR